MPLLGVNLDHVATVRQARRGNTPDLMAAARSALAGGADSITIHLREDRRYIQDQDVANLCKNKNIRVNLEMAPTEEMVRIARVVRPQSICLVPEKREELTTEGGLDVRKHLTTIIQMTKKLKSKSIRVGFFIEPLTTQVQAAKSAGADLVELHTGSYALAKDEVKRNQEFDKIKKTAETTTQLGLKLNAGHGLDYNNVGSVAAIPGMNELNIGFSIVARSLFVGLEQAIREMKTLVTNGHL